MILYLSNLQSFLIDPIFFSQFSVIPLSFNRPPICHQRGKKALASGQKPYKRKRKGSSNQNKNKNPTTSPSSSGPAINNPDLFKIVKIPAKKSLKNKLVLFYKQWKSEDHLNSFEGNQVVTRQRQQYKDVWMTVFGFELQEASVDAVSTLFYK